MEKRDSKKDRVVIQNLAALHGARLESVFNQSTPAYAGTSVPAAAMTSLLYKYGEKESPPDRDEMEVYLEDKKINKQNTDSPEAQKNGGAL